MSIHSHLPYDQSTSHARIPAGGINLIASIDSASEAQFTASFFGSTKSLHGENAIPSADTSTHNHSNQQYSITAVTTSAGTVAERYAYSAYGDPTILDGSGSQISNSSISNRYSYTGREWDATVGMHHFRARWMGPKTGRFLTRDPIGFLSGDLQFYEYLKSKPAIFLDPSGLLAICCRPMDVSFCGIGLGWVADHCQLRDACVPGETSSPVGVDDSDSRTMDNGKSCGNATRADIEACLARNPHSDQPFGPPQPGSNCQVGAALRLAKCCLTSNWGPDLSCWVQNRYCLEYGEPYIVQYPTSVIGSCPISRRECKRWGYWSVPGFPDVPADQPRCPNIDNESHAGWPRGVVPVLTPPKKPQTLPWWVIPPIMPIGF